FFFSSRRRHTRSKRDWSSDVCSSDLVDLREKLVVNATPWAVQTISGEPMQSSSGMTPAWFNENIERYWEEVGVRGIKIARVSPGDAIADPDHKRSEEHTSELQSRFDLVCRLLLEKKKQ